MATSSPQDAYASVVSKRTSGRVRKQRDIYTSSPYPTGSGKRKRNEEEADAEGDFSEESSENEGEGVDAYEGEIRDLSRRARKTKATATKPSQKKPKVNGASLPVRSANGAPKKRAPKKVKAVNAAEAAEAGGLFAEVFASGEELADIAGQWLARFTDEQESAALAEVVNLVLKCAGCSGQVTASDIEDPDGATNKLDDLREEYQATQPTDYPLIAKGKAATLMRDAINGFFNALVKALAVQGTLYSNPVLMENIQVWVTTMSTAPNRSFRHTATVVSLAIVTALCEVARDNVEIVAAQQRQAETERKRTKANKARVRQIELKAKEATIAQEYVESQLEDWFNVLFIHRYRDVDPLIRRDCINALGDWIITMPDVFFDGGHLRYMGWVLSDTSPITRAEVIQQLLRLYKENERLGGLKTFTEKFRPRMVEIATTDAETNVRVAGIQLLDLLRENGLLEPDDIDAVGRLIFDMDTRVRKAVAGFFSENVNDIFVGKVDELGGLESLEEALPDVGEGNYDAPQLAWLKFKSLAELLQSYDSDENLPSQVERGRADGDLTLHLTGGDSRFTLAADALYHKVEEIKDWQVLAGYLLFDHSTGRTNGMADSALAQLKHESVLNENEEASLLEVLRASVKHNLTEMAEKINAPKSKLTKRQKQDLEEEQEEAARNLANLIPRLLKKFGDVPSTAAAVLRVESVLNLPSLNHVTQNSVIYTTLLDDVRKQFMSHGTDEVLAPASSAILHAKSYGELSDLTEEKISNLWDDVISNLSELLNPATVAVRGASTFEEMTALSNNLLRIVRLSAVSDCISHLEDSSVAASHNASGAEYQGAIDYIIALVQRAIPASGPVPELDEAAVEDEIAGRAAEAALFYCRWKLKSIISDVTTAGSTGVVFEELEALAQRRDNYVDNMKAALQSRKAGDDVCISLAGCLLDLYSSAAILKNIVPQPGVSDDYIVLGMDLDHDIQKPLMSVFAAAEKNYAKLGNKKLEQVLDNVGAGEGKGEGEDGDAVDEDPLSESESEVEEELTQPQTQASLKRREAKVLNTLMAEEKLCALTGKIIRTVLAGLMLDEDLVRKRLQRNKTRLGHNYKEVVAYLDLSAMEKKRKAKSKKSKPAAANGTSSKTKSKADPKSNAIVAEDELDDEIEDEDADEEDALRRRGLVNDDEPEADAHDEEAVNDVHAESGSVLGD